MDLLTKVSDEPQIDKEIFDAVFVNEKEKGSEALSPAVVKSKSPGMGAKAGGKGAADGVKGATDSTKALAKPDSKIELIKTPM